MPGDNLDVSSEPPDRHRAESTRRRFVGVHFVCCDVYSRVYINPSATAYEGNCPKCAKKLRLRIGPGGTDSRFFTAY